MNKKTDIIYCDHSATTPLNPQVLDAMLPYLTENYANPSALYKLGRQARNAIEDARDDVADILNASADEIIFTGSGTESDNLAILGSARANKNKCRHIITTPIEHHAVLHCVEYLKKYENFEIEYVPVDNTGIVDIESLKNMIRPNTILVSIMYANNEIGTIEDIKTLAQIVKSINSNTLFHTDACQVPNYFSLDTKLLGIDLMTLNGSKIYGPKGVGILYKKRKTKIQPIQFGGEQEEGLRPGTENVANIVGFASALKNVVKHRVADTKHVEQISDYFKNTLKNNISYIYFNGHDNKRLPNNVHFSLIDIEAEAVLFYLDKYGICASSGSACTTKSLEPSHVLQAINVPQDRIKGSLRFSFGRANKKEEIDFIIKILKEIITELRNL